MPFCFSTVALATEGEAPPDSVVLTAPADATTAVPPVDATVSIAPAESTTSIAPTDVATLAAPVVQSTAWTFDDYLKGALSGAAGGLISAFGALVIGWMNNRNAQRLNKQKIDADQKALEKSHKQQIEKICYEEKRKRSFELLNEISDFTLIANGCDITNATKILTEIITICEFSYSEYAKQMLALIATHPILKKGIYARTLNAMSPEEEAEYQDAIKKYAQFFKVFVVITRKMLDGEELIPFDKWDFEDFEGSVPLDYRKLIS